MMHRRQFSLTTHTPEKPPLTHANAVHIPLKLDDGWNNLEINLQTLCNEIYGSDYQATQRIIIYPNCRVRRVYFQDKHYEQNETPVELCQAFFDMYMLKWGIHLVERSCQTEEIYTGPLQPCDLEYIATESNMSISVTTTSLPLYDDTRMKQIKEVMEKDLGISMTLCNGKTVLLKNNSKSLNQFGKKIEMIGNCDFKLLNSEHSPIITNYDVKSSHTVNKRKSKTGNSGEKARKKSEHRTNKNEGETQVKDKLSGDSQKPFLNFKQKDVVAKLFPNIEKSQYLRSQMGENFLNSNSEQSDQNCQGCSINRVKSRVQGTIDEKLNSNSSTHSNNLDPSLAMMKRELVQNLKAQINNETKKLKPDFNLPNNLRKVETYQGDRLPSHGVKAIEEVIDEVQKIRDQLINYNIDRRIPSEAAKDALQDSPCEVPPVVEIQATPSNERSKKAVLSTDKAVCDFLELRHAVNKKILEKLKDKGLTITEVELSIYNSKNRRNCYGQGKLIESGKGCTNKGSGLSSIEPVKMDVSLKKEQLSLNDKICMQLRNELDAALLQLKSTQVRVPTEVVRKTENIVKKDSDVSNSDFFTVQEAQRIKRKVYNDKILNREIEITPHINYVKNGKDQVQNFIQNLDKYSGEEIVNVLFQRQMHDSEAEYRSVQNLDKQHTKS